MAAFRVEALPQSPLEAAAEFHAEVLPNILSLLNPPLTGEELVLVFLPAPYDHRGWRLAVVQDLGRVAAPVRVNGIVGDDEEAIATTLAWLANAPGVTGQLLAVERG